MRRHSEPQCKDSNKTKTKTNDLLHFFLRTGVSMGKIMAELSQGDMPFKATICSTTPSLCPSQTANESSVPLTRVIAAQQTIHGYGTGFLPMGHSCSTY